MDFDFDRITAPFRMQPGLRRIDEADPQVHPLDPASPLYAEKRAVFAAGQSRYSVAGFDPSPALAALDARMPAADAPELAYQEDFAVLDGETGTLPWLCVCVPSHWAPEEKVGLGFAALHAPVADNQLLVSSSMQLVQLVTGGDCWERFVWTVSPSPRYDQHPRRHTRTPWPGASDPDAFAQSCWFRAERQTFFPVGGGTRQAMFTIRVMLQPLAEVVAEFGRARRLHDAIASMTDAVLAYKGLSPARAPLLRWLAARSA
jgi:hypothetical protein